MEGWRGTSRGEGSRRRTGYEAILSALLRLLAQLIPAGGRIPGELLGQPVHQHELDAFAGGADRDHLPEHVERSATGPSPKCWCCSAPTQPYAGISNTLFYSNLSQNSRKLISAWGRCGFHPYQAGQRPLLFDPSLCRIRRPWTEPWCLRRHRVWLDSAGARGIPPSTWDQRRRLASSA